MSDLARKLAARAALKERNVDKRVLAFYYPWYTHGSHWEPGVLVNGRIPNSRHLPARGAYDSHDPEIINQHCLELKAAGVSTLISSWWSAAGSDGLGFEILLREVPKHGLTVCPYYELPSENAAVELLGLLYNFADQLGWAKVNDRPVIFVYSRAIANRGLTFWLETIDTISKRYKPCPFFVGDTQFYQGGFIFDGLHEYDILRRFKGRSLDHIRLRLASETGEALRASRYSGGVDCMTILPGYDDTVVRSNGIVVPRHNGEFYKAQWEVAVGKKPTWVLINSWNEWHEGSEIEPSMEEGDRELRLTEQYAPVFLNSEKYIAGKPCGPESLYRCEKAKMLREECRGKKVAILEGDGKHFLEVPRLFFEDLRLEVSSLSWEQVSQIEILSKFDFIVYNGHESYTAVREMGVDLTMQALLLYLRQGGRVFLLPTGPAPFYYDDGAGIVTKGADALGLFFGENGGIAWEQYPNEPLFLKYQTDDFQLPKLHDLPLQVDQRLRTIAINPSLKMSTVPLVSVVRQNGDRLGAVASQVDYAGGGKLIYIWAGLQQSQLFCETLAGCLMHMLRS